MVTCIVHYGLDFRLVLQFLTEEYAAEWRDIEAVIAAVESHVSESDKDHIFWILTRGCPTKLVWEETAQNKQIFLKPGHSQSIKANWREVVKVPNKEE